VDDTGFIQPERLLIELAATALEGLVTRRYRQSIPYSWEKEMSLLVATISADDEKTARRWSLAPWVTQQARMLGAVFQIGGALGEATLVVSTRASTTVEVTDNRFQATSTLPFTSNFMY
jgi:hypothetical protein